MSLFDISSSDPAKANQAHLDSPLRADAFCLSDDEKIKRIQEHFYQILHILGLDLSDDSLRKTPERISKMYVREIFSGLNPGNRPSITLFDNTYRYNQMLIEKDITLFSTCEHHFVPIIGKVHMAYISQGKVIGLSKINRLIRFYAQRPQVQERLTNQIAEGLKQALETDHLALVIEASHLCVASRGIEDTNSSTLTTHYSGRFRFEASLRNDFLALLNKSGLATLPEKGTEEETPVNQTGD